jgi:hypothetical protein
VSATPSKVCTKCGADKPLSEYRADRRAKDGKHSSCKACARAAAKKRYDTDEEFRKALRRRDSTPSYKTQIRKAGQRRYSTLEGRTTVLLNSARRRASAKGLAFDLDAEWVIERLKHLRCEATGCDLSLATVPGMKANPFGPSLDRNDNTGGYTKDNVQVVAWFYNMLKADYPQGVVDRILRVIKHSRFVQ